MHTQQVFLWRQKQEAAPKAKVLINSLLYNIRILAPVADIFVS